MKVITIPAPTSPGRCLFRPLGLALAVSGALALTGCSSSPAPAAAPASQDAAASGTETSTSSAATAGGCSNLVATATTKAEVLAVELALHHFQHVRPVPGDFYYGACGATQYAATDFELTAGATMLEKVGMQDDGAVMQYYSRTTGGAWTLRAGDRIPRDPHGCAAISGVPKALATAWDGCPLAGHPAPAVASPQP